MDDELVILDVPLGDESAGIAQFEVSRSELADLMGSGIVLAAANNGSRLEATGFTLGSALDNIMPALRTILTKLRAGLHSPDEIGMEVGLKIGGEAGVVFAKGTTEASVTVTMKWCRELAGGPGAGLGADADPHDAVASEAGAGERAK